MTGVTSNRDELGVGLSFGDNKKELRLCTEPSEAEIADARLEEVLGHSSYITNREGYEHRLHNHGSVQPVYPSA